MHYTSRLLSLILLTVLSCQQLISQDFPSAQQTYQKLNQAGDFAFSCGTSMSQTNPASKNTMHPTFILKQMQKLAFQQSNPHAWLASPERIWYLLNALPDITCQQCNVTLRTNTFDLTADQKVIATIIDDLAQHPLASTLKVSKCPLCSGAITLTPKDVPAFTDIQKNQMVQLVDTLGVKNQIGCRKGILPTYRLSVEMSDVLQDNGSGEIDITKLQQEALWLQQLGNVLAYLSHYTLPLDILDLFETEKGIEAFSNYAQEFTKANPQITYICPVSQPKALSFRMKVMHNAPPFDSNLTQTQLFKNLIKAHVAASKKIKVINPHVKVLVSHQWKPVLPYHNAKDPRYYFEKLICSIVNKMYNSTFVDELKKHTEHFDGIALSVYPPIYFNMWVPSGNNCNGAIDAENSLESIMQMHKAFPDKEIIVAETGCNSADPETQRKYMDMILYVCDQARQQGAPVNGCFMWTTTNDNKYYREWNTKQGSANFGMFDTMDAESINAAGAYLKDTISAQQ